MSHRQRMTFGADAVMDTTAAASPRTFTGAGIEIPTSLIRGVAPEISRVRLRSAVPHDICEVPVSDRVATLSFDMANVSPAFANTLRRVMLTEVPTMAFDRIKIEENDGVVLDEVLSHRLGLCPIAAPIEAFDFIVSENENGFINPNPKQVLRFDLDVTAPSDAASPPITNVFAGSLTWVPLQGQSHWSVEDIKVVQPDILLAKLGRGQRIKLEAYAVKGIGAVHSKWSPVSACWYDMETVIELPSPLSGTEAIRLVECCPKKVFDLEDTVAVVKRPRKCTFCRECVKEENKDLKVLLQKDKNHVTFTLESLGQYPDAASIVRAALETFALRCRNLASLLRECKDE